MNVLLSAVGRRAYLVEYFKRSLSSVGGSVICTNTHMDCTGMLVADHAEVVPPASSAEYIPRMLEICTQYNVRLLFSLHDWESPFLARSKQLFDQVGTLLVMPSYEVISACLDKFQTYRIGQSLDIEVPQSYLRCEEVEQALRKGEVDFPIIVKPRWGQGSVGICQARTFEQLACAAKWANLSQQSCGSHMPDDSSGGQSLVFQAWISGQEYGCDIVNDLAGNFVTAFVKRKLAMRSGETDAAETVEHPGIAAAARRIAQWSQHRGIMDADFFVSTSGEVILLELNPRFGGGYPFSHVAGADLPGAFVAWASGRHPSPRQLSVDVGVRSYKQISLLTVG